MYRGKSQNIAPTSAGLTRVESKKYFSGIVTLRESFSVNRLEDKSVNHNKSVPRRGEAGDRHFSVPTGTGFFRRGARARLKNASLSTQ